jgi:tRNA (guanine37-N1)-methyltransferase
MHFQVITPFPEIFDSPLSETILKRAQDKGLIRVTIISLRNYADGKYLQLDDYPYGGGPGMVLKPEPIFRAFESLQIDRTDTTSRILFMSPQGIRLTQEKLNEFVTLKTITILCGRYKGVDQRVIDTWIDEEISIGDYVISGGEFAALVVIDGITRLIPGVLGNAESAATDTFQTDLLDYPIYTRPAVWGGLSVPDVLLQGDHKKIAEWRLQQSIQKTAQQRRDLYNKYLEKAGENKNE